MKKTFTLWIWTLDPWIWSKYFITGPSKQIAKVPTYQYKFHSEIQRTLSCGHFYWFGRFVPSTGIFTWTALWGFYVSGFGGPMAKYLQLLQGSWVQILGVNFNMFSCWHPWETRFKSGFHSSFWDFICGIWKWGMASSFWNHVIQISIRQVHFQDTYSQLWIVKIFNENIYFL
jgi:hypothetical protein